MIDSLLTYDWYHCLSKHSKLFVGFSGGLDSTVLLHLLANEPTLLSKIHAVHVHHNLSPNADRWQTHCQDICDKLGVLLTVHKVTINGTDNIEERARNVRYHVFSTLLNGDDCLLLAHHENDQAETVLLRLFRGSGVDGLAAMQPKTKFKKYAIYRPLLEIARNQLEEYANHHQLHWIEDESNYNQNFLRNYLRHQIIPLLHAKWPSITANLSRSANLFQEAKANLEALAKMDYDSKELSKTTLSITALKTLSRERIANVFRTWFKYNQIRVPSNVVLARLIHEVIFAKSDASPCVQWSDVCVKRYQDTLYLQPLFIAKNDEYYAWDSFPKPLVLKHLGTLVALPKSYGLQVAKNSTIEVGFRQGGETFFWKGQTKKLKKLMQAWRIPPWERKRTPLIYINHQLAVVVGYAVSDHFYEHRCGYQIQLLSGKHALKPTNAQV